jgi:hypothetical protein
MAVERTIIEWRLLEDTRETLRTAVLTKWAEESCGSADAFQRYRYNVEELPNNGSIYLHRPAFRNKGCDFIVNCEPAIPREDGKRYKNPRHQDLTRELLWLSEQLTNGKARILLAVQSVWNCENVSTVSSTLCNTIENPDVAFRAERALKVAKWLFIEQDITDWNTSGRAMFMNKIRNTLQE